MNEDLNYDFIDTYLDGKLSEDHSFVKQLNTNSLLKNEVEVQKILKEAVIDYRILQFQKALTHYHAEAEVAGSQSLKKRFFIIALLFLSIAGAIIFQANDKIKVKKNNASKNLIPIVQKDSIRPVKEETNIVEKNIDTKSNIRISKAIHNSTNSNKKDIKGSPINYTKSLTDSLIIGKIVPLPDTEGSIINQAKISFTKQDSCFSKHITGSIVSQPSCYGKNTGSITVAEAKGGTEPYQFSIDHEDTYNTFNIFNNLSPGTYSIAIKDKNNCIAVIDSGFVLKSKHCISIKNLTFNPEYVGAIELPKGIQEGALVTISDKSGQVIFNKVVSLNENIIWDGRVAGHLVLPGIYIYSIKYDSQSEEHGTISIMY